MSLTDSAHVLYGSPLSRPKVAKFAAIVLKGDRIFRSRRIPDYDRKTAAAIIRAQNELAFRKWRVEYLGQSSDNDKLVAS